MIDLDLDTLRVLKFETRYHDNPETGRKDRPVDWVLLSCVGEVNKSETWHAVPRLIPPEALLTDEERGASGNLMVARWNVIKDHYENFKKGTEIPTKGTPLAAWGLLNPEEMEIYKRCDIHTVEELAKLTESALGRVTLPNRRDHKRAADMFVKNASKVKMNARLTALEDEAKEKDDLIKQLQSKLNGQGEFKSAREDQGEKSKAA